MTFYRRFDMVPSSADLISGALDLHILHSLSFCDALIVQAAVASGCQRLLSEDMQHGAAFAGTRIENPFLAAQGPGIHAVRPKRTRPSSGRHPPIIPR